MSEIDPVSFVESIVVRHTKYEYVQEQMGQALKYSGRRRRPPCIAVVGQTKSGKTTAAEEIPLSNPPVFSVNGTVSHPVLFISTPTKPTSKNLSGRILLALGDPRFDKGQDDEKLLRVVELAKQCGVKMLIIDEFQHFFDQATSKVIHHAADTLKTVSDEVHIPIVVFGLPRSTSVLQQNAQLRGRFKSTIVLPQFDWMNSNDRAEFVAILEAVYTEMSREFTIPKLYSEDLAFRCHAATGGLVGFLGKILTEAVVNALDKGSRVIRVQDLATAHREAVLIQTESSFFQNPFAYDSNDQSIDIHAYSEDVRKLFIDHEDR